MEIELTLQNYRCFPYTRPATIKISKGFIALLGVNNSGKSSLLKFLYEFRPLLALLSSPTGNLVNALNIPDNFGFSPSVLDTEEVFSIRNTRDMEFHLRFLQVPAPGDHPKPNKLEIIIPRGTRSWKARIVLSRGSVPQGAQLRFRGNLLERISDGMAVADFSDLFEVCKSLSNTLYIGAYRNALNTGTNENYFDIQVGQAFIRNWRSYLTGTTKKYNEAAYRLTEDIKHIFGFKDLQINPSPDDTNLQIFVNGRSFRLDELGSGLAQFILVFAHAAIRDPSYILIDEPELNLHPSLQLKFLTTLGSYAREGVIFGTHNIGLAKAAGDLVYSLRKIDEGETEVYEYKEMPRLSEFLGELSFAGYKDLGFDKVLLVEGKHDVKTVQQFLEKYNKDHQMVLLPLGGSSLINASSEEQLSEIKRITGNVFVLIDSERDEAGKPLSPDRDQFLVICSKLKITVHVLERRAIEHYLTDAAVKTLKGPKYRALSPYEKRESVSPVWGKSENWLIAREMNKADIDSTDLGKFLNQI